MKECLANATLPLPSMEIEFTIDDPKAYTKPWTVTIKQALIPDTELLEEICLENEQSYQHYQRLQHR